VRQCTFKGFSIRKACLLLLLFFFFFLNGFGQEPNYTHDAPNSRNLDFFTVTIADAFNPQAKLDRLIISVDTNPEGERFVLTFGNGIKRVGDNDGLIDFIPNQNNRLSNPLDFAINSEGKFFVATNESNRRFIRVYSPEGVYLPNEELGNGDYDTSGADRFKGPTGLAFDNEDNLYVADHYIGNANPPRPSSIKIYKKDATGNYKNNLINEFDNVQGTLLNSPYRLAVNSQGNLYMAELGQNNNASIKILKFDDSFNPTQIGEISGNQIGSPGSIVIDKFDNIFVADFGDDINLARVLEATDDVDEFYEVFEIIKDGIENNIFNINVYNPNNTFRSKISSRIDFPVDLAISNCGTLYVNNTIFEGRITSFFGQRIPDISIDFDLEAYQRSPGYDTEVPVLVSCTEDQEESLNNGAFILQDYTNLPEFTDNCDEDLEFIQDPPENTSITETTEVSIIAIDDSGNESEACVFQVIIDQEEENTPPVFENCPSDIEVNNDQGECGAVVMFDTPTATDENGDVSVERTDNSGLDSGDIFPVGETTIIFEADDGTNDPVTCEFTITITDTEDPSISCPEIINDSVPFGETGKVIDYAEPTFDDNCENATISQTVGLASGDEFPIGTTTNTFIVNDGNGNTASCSFDVIIKEEEPEPSFTCPDPNQTTVIELDENCEFEEPDYRERVTNFQGFQNNPVLEQSSVRNGNILNITISVFDGAEEVGECSFPVSLEDQTPPSVNCPPTISVPYTETKEYVVEDYYSELQISDNCATTFEYSQEPAPGTVINNDTTVEFTVTDENENQSRCSFNIEFYKETELQILNCPGPQTIEVDSNCSYPTPDIESIIETNIAGAEISQNIAPGFQINGSILLTITAKFEDQIDTCEVQLIADDNIDPTISCLPDQTVTPDENGDFPLPNYILEAEYDDNCFIAETAQIPDVGTVINAPTEIELKVTDGSGNQTSCFFQVNFEDSPAKPFECKSSISFNLGGDETRTIAPEELLNITGDISDYQFELDRESFGCEDVTGQIPVTVTYTGPISGSCTVNVDINELVAPVVDCPEETLQVSYQYPGEYILPDYSAIFDISDNCTPSSELTVEQSPEPGTVYIEEGELPVTLKVSDNNGNETLCSFTINLIHNEEYQPPVVLDDTYATPINTTLTVDAPGVLANDSDPDGDSLMAIVEQEPLNGTLTLNQDGSFIYIPNTDFQGQDTFTYYATDGEGEGVATVTINVIEESQGNVRPVAVDDEYETLQDQELIVEAPGILANDFDANGDELTSIVRQGTPRGSFTFNSDGSFTYVPEPGFVGIASFTYTASDGVFESEPATVIVNVLPKDGFNFECTTQVTKVLDENGLVIIQPDELYSGDATGVAFTLSQTEFTCDDIGIHTVRLSYSKDGETGFCDIEVSIEDNTPPVIQLTTISIDLNETGVASILFSDIDAGSYDNCDSNVTYTLSKSVFSCKEVGTNDIQVIAEDSSGNRSTGTTSVTVIAENGICDGPPLEGSEYIFIYPNPNTGSFKVATPSDVTITRLEVFDHRGRFIAAKDYDSSVSEYAMNLGPLQEAVYVLKIVTNEKTVTKRFIFKY